MDDLLWWIIGGIVVLALAYRFWPKGRAAIDKQWDKVDKDGDGRGVRK